MDLNPNEIAKLLNLAPHPTCGLVKQTYLSKTILPKESLPHQFKCNRAAGSVLYFMLTNAIQIKLHKICSDQMYHFYLGCPVEVFLFYPNNDFEVKIMGNDLKANMVPQLFIPADTFHTTRMHDSKDFSYSLLGTSEWIGVKPDDIQVATSGDLIHLNPSSQFTLKRFMQKNQSIKS